MLFNLFNVFSDPSTQGRDQSDDESIIEGFRSGDPRALSHIERQINFHVCKWRARFPEEERKDIVQQSVMGVYIAVSRKVFKLKHGLSSLVRTIAVARCIDHLRKKCIEGQSEEHLMDRGPSPSKIVELKDEFQRVRFALGKLDWKHREAIRLRLLMDEPYSAIADQLGGDESYVRGLVFHGIRKIRKDLGIEV